MGSENKTRLTDTSEQQNFQIELTWRQLKIQNKHTDERSSLEKTITYLKSSLQSTKETLGVLMGSALKNKIPLFKEWKMFQVVQDLRSPSPSDKRTAKKSHPKNQTLYLHNVTWYLVLKSNLNFST